MGALRWIAPACVVATIYLAGCGGGSGEGGDSDPSQGTRAPLPQVVTDTNPSGTTLDFRSRNYFPSGNGDTWTYDLIRNGTTTPNAVTRSVSTPTADVFVVTENESGQATDTRYRRSTGGHLLESESIVGDSAPASVKSLIGQIAEYPEPFFPVGAVRQLVRQGSWGEDLDADGVVDSFRLEFDQTVVGFEMLTMPVGSIDAVRFRTVLRFTISPSMLSNLPVTVVATEETWWGPGVGLVRA